VRSLRIASMDNEMNPGKATEFVIRADAYVLACGAVANARQFLLSNAGNEHDLVGRNFMGHPLMNGVFTMNRDYLTADQARFMTGTSTSGHWHDQTTHVRVSARFIPNAETVRAHGIGRCWFAYNYGLWYFSQAPNSDSRITLSDSVDPVFGQRQTRCDWQLSPLDETTFQTATQLFANAVSALGGQVSVNFPWELVRSNLVINGHHMGTTRMAKDPAQGVVDPNLRVHSLENLYVAGSSVFPSAGVSNPTFTIIALSIRLADHLKGVLGRR
jgi:choline dehydrogenase-like flavoprotein